MKPKCKILIVEDEGIIATDIRNMLRRLGYAVSDTTSMGVDAVAKAEQLRPDLVLMDIVLAGTMDGVSAADEIRRFCKLPVLFLTAHSDASTLERAKRAERYGFIVKPVVEQDLRVGIEMALHKHAIDLRLAESEQWFFSTLASIGEAVIATDVQGRIHFLNPVAVAITGSSADDAQGQPLAEVLAFTPNSALGQRDPVSAVLAEGIGREWGSRNWVQLETYLAAHSDAQFTHTLGPTCVRALFPEIAGKILGDATAQQNEGPP